MIVRTLLAAVLAGLFTGALVTPVQQAKLVPLIVQAETYEDAGAGGTPAEATSFGLVSPARAMDGMDGMGAMEEGDSTTLVESRWLGTLLANLVLGAGFALVMVAASLLLDVPITARNGVLWGLAAFATATLAPALGLPPQLPAMPVADTPTRQVWWLVTAGLTAGGIYFLALRRLSWAIPAGLALLLMTQALPVPQPADLASAIPPTLAARFAVTSLAVSALLWLVLGMTTGYALDRARRAGRSAA